MSDKVTNVPKVRFKGFIDDWEQRKVTEIGKIYIGLVTTMTKHYTDNGTLLIRNSDIKDGRFEFGDNPIYLEKSFAQKNESRMHQLGDVITVHTGDVGTSAVITENEVKSIGFATIVTRPNREIMNSEYLCSFLNTDKHKKWAVGISTGDGRSNYNLGDYYELVVPVPEIKEQQKIAELIKKVNDLITLHQRELDSLANTKKYMLKKMIPKNGEDTPEIRFDGFTDAWKQKVLGDVVISFEYGLNAVAKEFDGIHKYIRITDIDDSSREFIQTNLTSPDIQFDYADNYKLKKGDMLLARTGASVGKSYHYKESDGLVYFAGFLIRARIKSEFSSDFVFQNTFTNNYNKFIKNTSQRSGQPGVNAEEYSNFKIMIPSLEEQIKIGTFFLQLDQLITSQQRKLNKLKHMKKTLLKLMFV